MPTLLASAVASAQSLKNEEPPVEPSPAKKFEVAVPPRTASLNEFQKFPEEDEETKDDDVDDEPIEPAYYSQGTAIPVFTPVRCALVVLLFKRAASTTVRALHGD
jgi:hypothetical protein